MRNSNEDLEDKMPTGIKNLKITQELSDENEHSLVNGNRDHSCNTVKNLSAFWPCPKILYKANVKNGQKKFQCI